MGNLTGESAELVPTLLIFFWLAVAAPTWFVRFFFFILTERFFSLFVFLCEAGSKRGGGSETEGLTSILNPIDEFQYWAESAMSASKLAVRERAQHFHSLFQSVADDFANMDSLSFADALELIEVRLGGTRWTL